MFLKESIIPKDIGLKKNPKGLFLDSLARKGVISKFQKLIEGRLIVCEEDETLSFGNMTGEFPVSSTIKIRDPRMYSEIASKGLNGAAEAYVNGWWECDDLTSLVRIFVRNRQMADNLEGGLANIASWLFILQHSLRKNSRENSLKNISAHYDLGNEFFSTFLDDTKMYSCGIYQSEKSTLKEASVEKLDRICKKLELCPEDNVLEIGTGWGGFALHAANEYGCKVTTTTISQKQFEYACQKIKEAGLNDKVKVIKKDYRDLDGQYDKLVTIEMIEAVGYQYYEEFFQKCSSLLRSKGSMLLQGIIIVDNLYEESKDFADFIKTYIFPGSCIPSISALCQSAANTTDMRLFHLEDITPHYARTLKDWRKNYMRNVQQIRDQGFSEAFIRLWNFYFCYCEGGFLERQIGNVQMLFRKPLCRMDPILPELGSQIGKKEGAL